MRSVIKREQVREEHGPRPKSQRESRADACSGAGAPAPGLRLVEANGRVHAIELTCKCGEVSLIELEYDTQETSSGE